MDRSLVKSLAWKAAGDWVSQIFSWASLLVVVRLLTPADFGMVGMAVILLPYLRYLGEFGIPRAILTLRDLTDDQIAQLNTVAVLLGAGAFGLSVALARPLAAFFRTPVLSSSDSNLPSACPSGHEGTLRRAVAERHAVSAPLSV